MNGFPIVYDLARRPHRIQVDRARQSHHDVRTDDAQSIAQFATFGCELRGTVAGIGVRDHLRHREVVAFPQNVLKHVARPHGGIGPSAENRVSEQQNFGIGLYVEYSPVVPGQHVRNEFLRVSEYRIVHRVRKGLGRTKFAKKINGG